MGAAGSRPKSLDRLESLIAVWRTSGTVLDDEGHRASEITGTDGYQWLAGRWFVVHHVDVTIDGRPVIAIELIGYDATRDVFWLRSFDNEGAIADMVATIDAEGTWTFTGGGDVATAASGTGTATAVRSTLSVAPDGQSMHAHWERSLNGRDWTSWMLVDFARER